ncbi:MAG: oxygen-independent coproporphyrinogen III oxidase [Parabacteroides sp.]|nr:oxygen-independent coproporphyrinogen III oxidase [Parabacteroides sp.]
MRQELLEKYNVPVPRYTSYPPANYFDGSFTSEMYETAIKDSNGASPNHISFYVHIPFCRHLCHYCGCNSFPMMRPEVVDRYIAALHKEIDRVIPLLDPSRPIAQIHYGGGSPTALPVRYLKELNEHMLSAFDTIENPEIAIECHPGYLDEIYWQGLVEAGFNRFSLGVQDLDEKVLKVVNRRPSLLPLETIFRIARTANVRINMDFIYGLPYQTAESFAATLSKAVELEPDRLVTFSYAHVPWVNKRQLILEQAGLPSGKEKGRMYQEAVRVMHEAGYNSVGMDHFVREGDELYQALLDGRLHRNFQGYCTRRTTGQVYAFGVTGISQLDSAYAQNSKDINEYMECAESGVFAIRKGYALSPDEQIIRGVIESLMCNSRIDWLDLSHRFSLPIERIWDVIGYDKARIRTFVEDGLVLLDTNGLRMTDEGALFVRNVAASFDKLMLHSSRLFSKPV